MIEGVKAWEVSEGTRLRRLHPLPHLLQQGDGDVLAGGHPLGHGGGRRGSGDRMVWSGKMTPPLWCVLDSVLHETNE